MLGKIYKIENNINDKIYIGQTIRSLKERLANHKIASKNEDTALYRAFNKYGENNFFITLIEEVDIKKLNEREEYWIKYYDSYNKGYNSTLGDGGIKRLNYDIIKKYWDEGYSITEISKKTEYYRNTISKILKENYGVSEESIILRGKEKKNKLSTEKILLYWEQGMTPNQIAKTYGSDCIRIKNRLISLGISEKEINFRINENQRTSTNEQIQGYWNLGLCISEIEKKYGGNYHTIKKQLMELGITDEEINNRFRKKCNKNKKSIAQLDKYNNIITIYESAAEACRQTGIANTSINACCNHKPKYKTAGGYKWEFLDNIQK